jgi:hypothetical protein
VVDVAPKRLSVPIVVYAGPDIKSYRRWGEAAVAEMDLRCPVQVAPGVRCGARLVGNGWDARIAKRQSRGYQPEPERVRVHRLICPACRKAGRHPWNFTVLPSFLAPRKHFLQTVRLWVFDRHFQHGERPEVIEERTGVDAWLITVWLAAALPVLRAALPALAAELLRLGGRMPPVAASSSVWERWWALGLALRSAWAAVDPELGRVPGSVLEFLTVLGSRRQRWWAP